jgi:hypothetical protein
MHDITISPAQLEDLPAIAKIYIYAFRPSPIMSKVLRPTALHRTDLSDEDRMRMTAASLRRDYIDGRGAEDNIFFKAVRDGEIVGYSVWGRPELEKREQLEGGVSNKPAEVNPEEDSEAIARLGAEFKQKRAVLMGDRPHW